MVLGPQRAFAPEEVSALERHMEGGGALLLALEPPGQPGADEARRSLGPLLARAQVAMHEGSIASRRQILPMTRSRADRLNLITDGFGGHPAVSSLGRPGGPDETALFPVTGALEARPAGDPERAIAHDALARSGQTSWLDVDGDLERDPDEPPGPHTLALAVTSAPRPGADGRLWRGVILADATSLSDLALERSPGNTQFLLDVTNWLIGESELAGGTTSGRDVRLVHSRQGAGWIFYGTTLGGPALLLLLGAWWTRRRRR